MPNRKTARPSNKRTVQSQLKALERNLAAATKGNGLR